MAGLVATRRSSPPDWSRSLEARDQGRHLIEIGGKLASYSGPITDAGPRLVRDLSRAISPLALIDFEQARARLDRMARSVPLEEPWLAAKALDWDGQTFATWMRGNARTAAARTLFGSPQKQSGRRSRATSRCCTSSSTSARAAASTRCSAGAPSRTASGERAADEVRAAIRP